MTPEDRLKFDRMEESIVEIEKNISKITVALVGSELNDNRGLVHEVSDMKSEIQSIKQDLEKFEREKTKADVYIGQLKFLCGVLVTVIVTSVGAYLISKVLV